MRWMLAIGEIAPGETIRIKGIGLVMHAVPQRNIRPTVE